MSSAEERAKERLLSWSSRLVAGPDPGSERVELTPDEAWLGIGQLTRALWLQQGREVTFLPRSQWPSRLYRRGEVRDDDDP